jgi:7-cyano-7-deazaguanine synthase
VETIGFDYGQRHRVELDCRSTILQGIKQAFPRWAPRLGEDHLLKVDVLRELGATALTAEVEIRMQDSKLPNTFVPGRNIVFFTLAAALAYRRGIRVLVGGMCETDFSGYPDCRDDTVKAVQVALGLGMDTRFTLETPLMWLDKADTWRLAESLGGKELVRITIEDTHTCYLGDRKHRHDWGFGCGRCPACELRKQGFLKFQNH